LTGKGERKLFPSWTARSKRQTESGEGIEETQSSGKKERERDDLTNGRQPDPSGKERIAGRRSERHFYNPG